VTHSRIALVIAGACTLAACAVHRIAPGEPKEVAKLVLAPYASHDDCVDLTPSDRLEYRFESAIPVTFGIRYRDGNVLVMPITREQATVDAGIFAPVLAREYCLTWEAGAAGAIIDYRALIRRAGR
jgi:hypothetical protein